MVLTLIGGFKAVFTVRSYLTAVENRLVRKSIFGLVVTHIGFVHFRPLKVVLIFIRDFKVDFTTWSKLIAVGKPSGFKAHIRLSGYPYRVCPFSTIKSGFDIDKRF